MRKALKLVHSLGAAGLIGALATCAVLLLTAPQDTPQAYAAMRRTIDAVNTWLLMPSLGAVLLSGLFAMAAHKPFLERQWVWIKAALGLGMFEGTMLLIHGRGRRAAEASAEIAAGGGDPAALAELVAREWGALAVIAALAVANVALAIWRPRFASTRPPEAGA